MRRPDRWGIAMRAKQLIVITAATMFLIGGAAAVGAASPADQANESPAGADEDNVPVNEEAHNASTESVDRAGNADGIGPSDGLPEQVPDHVSQIHETIESFLTGSVDNLGESLNELPSGGEQTSNPADNASEQPEDADGGLASNK